MPDIAPHVQDMLALSLVPGLGPRLTDALLRHFGSAAAVRRANYDQLVRIPHIGEKLGRQFADALRNPPVENELELIRRHEVSLLAIGDPLYPPALASSPDAPPLLYYRGTLTEADRRAIGIVGSRKCSAYGRRMAEQIATGLVRAGYTIVSGLALGIDGAAHGAALRAGGRTIAVLANGLASIYPPEHVDLSREVQRSGCVVSETPMAMAPQAGMFHARNRIISGLSQAVVIVEAGERSGAQITASHAATQGREVFAVPGNVDSPYSAGTLRLLRDGARLVRHADDILEDLAGIAPVAAAAATSSKAAPPVAPPPPPQLDGEQQRIWDALADGQRHFDDLVRALGMPVAQLQSMLMMLEMKKAVRRLPGNQYERR
jgi:DNA processing protein